MFDTLRAWFRARSSATRQAALDAEVRETVLTTVKGMVEQLKEDWTPEPVVDTERESGFIIAGQEKDLTEQSLSETRLLCRRLARTNPTAKGIVRTPRRSTVSPPPPATYGGSSRRRAGSSSARRTW
jgi:hypothetical protein